MAVSEIARIRENIANEYKAATWGLSGLAYGVPRHDFINARMENIGEGQKQLTVLVGGQQAAALMADTLGDLPDTPERGCIFDLLIYLRGNTEATAYLIDHIQDMWEIIDMLHQEFGEEDAQKIITAPGSPFSTVREPQNARSTL